MTVRCISIVCDLIVPAKNRKQVTALNLSAAYDSNPSTSSGLSVKLVQFASRAGRRSDILADMRGLALLTTGTASFLLIHEVDSGRIDSGLIRGYKIKGGRLLRYMPKVLKTRKAIAAEIAHDNECELIGAAQAKAIVDNLRVESAILGRGGLAVCEKMCVLQAKEGGRESILMGHADEDLYAGTILAGTPIQSAWLEGRREMQAFLEPRDRKTARLVEALGILRAGNEGTAAAERGDDLTQNPYDAPKASCAFAWASSYVTRKGEQDRAAEYAKSQRNKVAEYHRAICSALGLDEGDAAKITPADVGRLVTMLSAKSASMSDTDDTILERIATRLSDVITGLPAKYSGLTLRFDSTPSLLPEPMSTDTSPIALPELAVEQFHVDGSLYGLQSRILVILHDEDDSMSLGGIAIKVHEVDSGVYHSTIASAVSDLVREKIVRYSGGLYSFRAKVS